MKIARTGRLLVVTAAVWAAGASVFLFNTTVKSQGIEGTLVRGSGAVVEHVSREQSWYEAYGPVPTAWLVGFSVFYLLAIPAAWKRKRVLLGSMTLVAFAMSIITGFSIGAAYLPAAIALLTGSALLAASGRRAAQ